MATGTVLPFVRSTDKPTDQSTHTIAASRRPRPAATTESPPHLLKCVGGQPADGIGLDRKPAFRKQPIARGMCGPRSQEATAHPAADSPAAFVKVAFSAVLRDRGSNWIRPRGTPRLSSAGWTKSDPGTVAQKTRIAARIDNACIRISARKLRHSKDADPCRRHQTGRQTRARAGRSRRPARQCRRVRHGRIPRWKAAFERVDEQVSGRQAAPRSQAKDGADAMRKPARSPARCQQHDAREREKDQNIGRHTRKTTLFESRKNISASSSSPRSASCSRRWADRGRAALPRSPPPAPARSRAARAPRLRWRRNRPGPSE